MSSQSSTTAVLLGATTLLLCTAILTGCSEEGGEVDVVATSTPSTPTTREERLTVTPVATENSSRSVPTVVWDEDEKSLGEATPKPRITEAASSGEVSLAIDPERCIGCGKCVRFAPDHFELDRGEHKAIVLSQENLDDSGVERAIAICPERAIELS